ncbi:hypothetical protein [Pontitalea aquivivens]|uniref:hypothetical protein n=1 Tax=Pontitalea aquivivens TaxID=3388663 RepID=UPI003970DF84
MKNWFRKTRRRDKVEFILRGSTTAFKKCRYVNVMWLAYILAPLSGKAKSAEAGIGRHQSPAGGVVGPSLSC